MEISQYKILKLRKTKLKNLGYRYQGRLLKNNLSSIVYENRHINGYLQYVEKILQNVIFSIKSIKRNINYLVDKDTDFIN